MCAEHSERQRVPSIGSFNVNYNFGFMLHVVACVLEWLSERTHPVESRGQEFHWMGVCPRTAALRLCSVPHLPSTQHKLAVIWGLSTEQLRWTTGVQQTL